MSAEVSVIGVGMSRFGRYPEADLPTIAAPAIREALADAGVTRDRIQAAYCGNVYHGMGAGQSVLQAVGIGGIPVLNVENACSSGSSAFREAVAAVGSGRYEVALVVGAEKLTSLGGGALPLNSGDPEVARGMVMPALYAMRAQRHRHEYGTTDEQLAKVAVKNHRNSVHNPKAQYRREYTLAEVQAARPVATPLTLLHCCPTGDGAAAAVVVRSSEAHRYPGRPVRVRASALRSGTFRTTPRDMAHSGLTIRTVAAAYEAAGLGPQDVDVAEVHDAFTISELMYYEALGFCAPGEGGRMIDEGRTDIGGTIPVNPSGGLLSKGHPLGATGVAQIVEVVNQLRGECGPRQVAGARIGLTHCTGGGVAGFDHIACTVHLFEAAGRGAGS